MTLQNWLGAWGGLSENLTGRWLPTVRLIPPVRFSDNPPLESGTWLVLGGARTKALWRHPGRCLTDSVCRK